MTSPIVLWTTVLEPQIWRYVVILQSLMGPYLDVCADDSRHGSLSGYKHSLLQLNSL